LFLVASRNIYIKTTIVADIYIDIFREFRDINTIILFVNTIDSLYIDTSSNNY